MAYAQSQGIPAYVINRENLYTILPKLKVAQWIKDWIINDVNAGYQVIIPEQELTIGQWRGTGWASLDEHGLGAYIITGGLYEALHGGYGTEVMNTYDGAGDVGENGENVADEVDNAKVEKTTLDALVELLLPSFDLRDLILEECLKLAFATITVLLAFAIYSFMLMGF